jgi:hypothetical protein
MKPLAKLREYPPLSTSLRILSLRRTYDHLVATIDQLPEARICTDPNILSKPVDGPRPLYVTCPRSHAQAGHGRPGCGARAAASAEHPIG